MEETRPMVDVMRQDLKQPSRVMQDDLPRLREQGFLPVDEYNAKLSDAIAEQKVEADKAEAAAKAAAENTVNSGSGGGKNATQGQKK